MTDTRALIVMGVSGSGKTTVGRHLADALGWQFIDADDLHSAASIEKMRSGEALTDADRHPWLHAVRTRMDAALDAGERCVVACSALKREYRNALRAPGVCFVYLEADRALARERLQSRTAHFFDPGLIDSQYEALEEPEQALVVSAAQPPALIVRQVLSDLGKRP